MHGLTGNIPPSEVWLIHFGNQSPWCSANEKSISQWAKSIFDNMALYFECRINKKEKSIDSLVAWLLPTIDLPGLRFYKTFLSHN